MDKVRVLFLPSVDADNTNAQSLNVREISLRLDPERLQSTLWYEREPDARLRNRLGTRLLQLPARGKTLRIFREMLAGYDLIAYMDYSPASYLFVHLPKNLRSGTKSVSHVEGAAQMTNPSRTLRVLHNGVFPFCDAHTAITEFVAQDVFSTIRKRPSHILPVGVDTALFTPPKERTNAVPVVLFAGALIERKGPQYLVDAAVRFPGAMFRLVGAGREGFQDVLQRRISELGLGNIKLEGPKTQPQLLQIMRESDIFLLPSRLEGLPKVTLEASATGLPCVVFRDYETPSVVDGVTGFQVSTPEEMMGALGRFIADSALRKRMGAAAREHIQKFDWNLVAPKWQSAYLEIAGSHRGPARH
jgi:glycosyltransferase involved in cell wall biosynthesis